MELAEEAISTFLLQLQLSLSLYSVGRWGLATCGHISFLCFLSEHGAGQWFEGKEFCLHAHMQISFIITLFHSFVVVKAQVC